MQRKQRVVALVAGGLTTLAMAGGGLKVWAEQGQKDEGQEAKIALPAEQVIASIRTAVAAKPGRVMEVEAEREKGTAYCEVKVLADDGKTYEVAVDVAANKAVEVELDNDKDDDEDAEHEDAG
ncbi:MAG: hypothetical protein M3347_17250 [Armatimonadota bacterium]|nr:hypothetical protein [Armatimonadota bacterium]